MVGLIAATNLAIQALCATGMVDVAFSQRLAAHAAQLPGCLARFADYDNAAVKGHWKQNPSFYLKDLDFTCVSPWNSFGRRLRAGTAISRRHIVFARHFAIPVGTRIAFVGESGQTTHYAIQATKALGGRCDIMVGLLDYELTPDIHPAKLLPDDCPEIFKDGSTWPVVTFNQNEQAFLSAFVSEWDAETQCLDSENRCAVKPDWCKFAGKLVVGDSGNPAFLIYGTQPILLYCLQTGGVGRGPMLHHFRRALQKTMDDLCPGYRLELAF